MIETKFKNTEIGPIPVDWEVKSLGEVIEGCNYGVAARAIKYNGKDKYIRITDIDDISHRFCPQPISSPDSYSEEHVLTTDDLVIARTGSSVGKSYLYDEKDGRLIYAGFLIKLHVTNANSRYIFYHTLTQRYMQWIGSQSARTGQPGINSKEIQTYQLPVPPLTEQEAIGGALREVDELIEGLKKLVAKKRAIKQGAMSQLLSGKSRLPGFSEPWKVVTLGEIGNLLPNNTLSWEFLTGGSSIRNIHYGQILTRFGAIVDVSTTELPIICKSLEPKFLKSNIAQDGDIVFADTAEDDTVGKAIELVNIEDKRVVSGLHTFWYRPKTKFAARFLGYALNCPIFHSQIPPLATGTKVSSISKPNLLKLALNYPTSLSEQEAIAKVLTDMDAEIEALSRKVAKYEQVKQGMMQQLLTGKIRLI